MQSDQNLINQYKNENDVEDFSEELELPNEGTEWKKEGDLLYADNETITVNGEQITGKIVKTRLPNGNIYMGQWDFKNNYPQGQGNMYDANFGSILYEGDFEKGQPKITKMFIQQNASLTISTDIVNSETIMDTIVTTRLPNGNIYIGQWDSKNDCPQGKGKMYDKNFNSILYEGNFEKGQPKETGTVDKFNIPLIVNGNLVTGPIVKKKFGSGTEVLGQWDSQNNCQGGKGICTYFDGDYKYEGELKNYKQDGQGKLYEDNYRTYNKFQGTDNQIERKITPIYEGGWLNGQKHGHGTCFYGESIKYTGNFMCNRCNGYGVMTRAAGTFSPGTYTGTWKDDDLKKGTAEYLDGNKYTGELNELQPHGRGCMEYSNGAKYDGNWKDGRKEKTGTYTLPNGETYSGEFSYDTKQGVGVYTLLNGCKIVAQWYNDELQPGAVIFIDKHGTQYKGNVHSDNNLENTLSGELIDNNSGDRYWLKFSEDGKILEFRRTNSTGQILGEGFRNENGALVGKIYDGNGNIIRDTAESETLLRNISNKMRLTSRNWLISSGSITEKVDKSKTEDAKKSEQGNPHFDKCQFFNELLHKNILNKKHNQLYHYTTDKINTPTK